MSRRENFFNTINHKAPENLILDLGGCPLSSLHGSSERKLLDFLGFRHEEKDKYKYKPRINEELLKYLDIDTRSVGDLLTPSLPEQKEGVNVAVDEWGIVRKYTGKYWDIIENPLRGAEIGDLDKYNWPDPDSINIEEIEYYSDQAKYLYNETDYIVVAEHPVYGIFELGCWLCGFDDFLLKMALDEAFVYKLFEILLDYQKKVIEIYYGMLGPYIHYTTSGDDFATQTSLFISPEMFDRMIKPYFKERINYTKKYTKASYLHHSCGNVHDIIPSLADAGVDILNPVQPVSESMAPRVLKDNFGDMICFHGGIDTQRILPFAKPDEIKGEVKRVAGILGKNGGYIMAAAHNIQDDVPPENIIALFKAARSKDL